MQSDGKKDKAGWQSRINITGANGMQVEPHQGSLSSLMSTFQEGEGNNLTAKLGVKNGNLDSTTVNT